MQIRPYFRTITSSAPTSHTVSSSTHGVQHSRSWASLVIDTILIVPRHPGSTAQWLKIFHFHPSCDRNRPNRFKVIQVHLGDSFTAKFDLQPLKSQVPSSTTQHKRSTQHAVSLTKFIHSEGKARSVFPHSKMAVVSCLLSTGHLIPARASTVLLWFGNTWVCMAP